MVLIRRRALAVLAGVVLVMGAVGAGWSQFREESDYLSVRTDKANVRENPSEGAAVLWRMWKYFPVKIVSFRGDWVRIRDFEGDEGWMERTLLSDLPCVQTKRKDAKLYNKPNGKVLWILDTGYSFRVFGNRGEWLEVSDLGSASGWIHESSVWGAPPPSPYK